MGGGEGEEGKLERNVTLEIDQKMPINSAVRATTSLEQIHLTKGGRHLLNCLNILLCSGDHPVPLPASPADVACCWYVWLDVKCLTVTRGGGGGRFILSKKKKSVFLANIPTPADVGRPRHASSGSAY